MTIEVLKEFFMWNVILNLALFLFTTLMSVRCKRVVYDIHGRLFGLNEDTINTMLYGFLAMYKIIFFVFALVPWITLCIMS